MSSSSSFQTQDYYQILSISRNATPKEIRRAYLQASLKNHPDKNPNDAEGAKQRFVAIGQAYKVLYDAEDRKKYDIELIQGGSNKNRSSYRRDSTNHHNTPYQGGTYEDYRDIFASHMASMSDEEIQRMEGFAAGIGSWIGAAVGAHLSKKGGRLGKMAGSLIGSEMGSELSRDAVRTVHGMSLDRISTSNHNNSSSSRGSVHQGTRDSVKEEEGSSASQKWNGLRQLFGEAKSGLNTSQQLFQAVQRATATTTNPTQTSFNSSSTLLPNGSSVILHSLKNRANLNNRTGTVVDYDAGAQRYIVQVKDVVGALKLKPDNISPIVQAD